MTSTRKAGLQLGLAVLLVVVGCGLLIAGFIVSPTGQIHQSVLVAFGEVMTFAGAILGVDYHYRFSDSIRSRGGNGDGKE